MARLVAAFGAPHSTMLFSTVEHWRELFDHVDCRASIHDFAGKQRSYEELVKAAPDVPLIPFPEWSQYEGEIARVFADFMNRTLAAR
jgi:hypothetical protein